MQKTKRILNCLMAIAMATQTMFQPLTSTIFAQEADPIVETGDITATETLEDVAENEEVAEEIPEVSNEAEDLDQEDEEIEVENEGKVFKITHDSTGDFQVTKYTLTVTQGNITGTYDGSTNTIDSKTFSPNSDITAILNIDFENAKNVVGTTGDTITYQITNSLFNLEDTDDSKTYRFSNETGKAGTYKIKNNVVTLYPDDPSKKIVKGNMEIKAEISAGKLEPGGSYNISIEGKSSPIIHTSSSKDTVNSTKALTSTTKGNAGWKEKQTQPNVTGVIWDASEGKYFAEFRSVTTASSSNKGTLNDVKFVDQIVDINGSDTNYQAKILPYLDSMVIKKVSSDKVTFNKGEEPRVVTASNGWQTIQYTGAFEQGGKVELIYQIYLKADYYESNLAVFRNLGQTNKEEIDAKNNRIPEFGYSAKLTVRKSLASIGTDENGFYALYNLLATAAYSTSSLSGVTIEDYLTTEATSNGVLDNDIYKYVKDVVPSPIKPANSSTTYPGVYNKETHKVVWEDVTLPTVNTTATVKIYFTDEFVDLLDQTKGKGYIVNNRIEAYTGDNYKNAKLRSQAHSKLEFTKDWIHKDGKQQANGSVQFVLKANGGTNASGKNQNYWGGQDYDVNSSAGNVNFPLAIEDKLGKGWMYCDADMNTNGKILIKRYTSSDQSTLVDTGSVDLGQAKKGKVTINYSSGKDADEFTLNDPADHDASGSSWKIKGHGLYYYVIEYYAKPTPKNWGADITNTVGVGVWGDNKTYSHEASYNGLRNYNAFIEKEGLGFDFENNTAKWKTEVYSDVSAGSYVLDTRMKNDLFYLTNEQLQNIVVKLGDTTVSKSDYTVSAEAVEEDDTSKITSFKVTFNKALSGTYEKPISITYDVSLIDGYYDNYADVIYNEADLMYKDLSGEFLEGTADADQKPDSEKEWITKTHDDVELVDDLDGDGHKDYIITWKIRVNENGDLSGSADLTEIIPFETKFYSAKVTARGKNASNVTVEGPLDSDTNNLHEIKKFKINGLEAKTDAFVEIEIKTIITDPSILGGAAIGSSDVRNTAYLVYNGQRSYADDITVVETHTLKKNMKEYSPESAPLVLFTLDINEDNLDILGGEGAKYVKHYKDTSPKQVKYQNGKYYVLVTDKLGEKLTFTRPDFNVTSNGRTLTAAELQLKYSKATNTFTFYVPADAPSHVEYYARLNAEKGEEVVLENSAQLAGAYPDLVIPPATAYKPAVSVSQESTITIVKTDSETFEALAGAEFTLYKVTASGTTLNYQEIQKETTDETGIINFSGLNATDIYAIKETSVPEGYFINKGVTPNFSNYVYYSFNSKAKETEAGKLIKSEINTGTLSDGLAEYVDNEPSKIEIDKRFKGEAKDGEYYFGIFASETATTPLQKGSIKVTNGIVENTLEFTGLKAGNYYVYETDKAGKKLGNSANINGENYTISGQGKVTITTDKYYVKSIITNTAEPFGKLVINKAVVGDNSSKTFEFEVTGPNNYKKTVSINYPTAKSVSIDKLTPGSYTVKEVGANKAAYSVSGEGNVTVKAGETGTINITNTVIKGTSVKLVGTKYLSGVPSTVPFQFTMTQAATDSVKASITNGTVSNNADGTFEFGAAFEKAGTYNFTVKEAALDATNAKKYLIDGTVYNIAVVVEAEGADYVVKSVTNATKNDDGTYSINPAEGKAATFENAPILGNLKLKKVVSGDKTFNFTIKLTDENKQPVSGTFGTTTFTNGQATVALGNNEEVEFTNIPVGTTYTITEETNADYVLTWTKDGKAASNATGSIVGNTTIGYVATNTEISGTKVTLVGTKYLDGKASTVPFEFTMEEDASDAVKAQIANATVTNDGSGAFALEASFNKAGTYNFTVKEAALKDSNAGKYKVDTATYKIAVVVELSGSNYVIKSVSNTTKNDDGTYTITPATGKVGTFENETLNGSLIIKKNVKLDGKDTTSTDVDGVYNFEIYSGTKKVKDATVKITNGKSNTTKVDDLTPGTYTVKEVLTADQKANLIQLISENNVSVEVTAGNVSGIKTAEFTNDRTKIGGLVIKKVLVGETSGTFKFTVKGEDGNFYKADASVATEEDNIIELSYSSENTSITINNLPPQKYTVNELVEEANYKVTGLGDVTVESGKTSEITIKNLPLVEVPVKKVWTDNVIGKDAVTVMLFADGTSTGKSAVLSAGNRWESKFSKLPKYTDAGALITYTVKEEVVEGFYTEYDGTTVINTKVKPISIDLTAKKYLDGKPSGIEFNFEISEKEDDAVKATLPTGKIQNSTDGNITISGIEFENAGTYNFTVKETAFSDYRSEMYVFDETTYDIKVVVKQNNDVYVVESITGATKSEDGSYEMTPAAGKKATWENSSLLGNLKISKTLGGNDPQTSRVFNFDIQMSRALNGTFSEVEFKDGKATVQLKGGQSKLIEGLPNGIGYKVTEREEGKDKNVTTYEGQTGTIVADTTAEVKVNNYRDTFGNLTVGKIVSAREIDVDKKFEFTVTLDKKLNEEFNGTKRGNDDVGTAVTVRFKDGVATIVLKHGEELEIKKLPSNTKYTVAEKDYTKDGYVTTWTGSVTGKISENGNPAVVATNKATEVSITKTDVWGLEELKGAELSIVKDGVVLEKWISDGNDHVINYLEPGQTYDIIEDQAPLGYTIANKVTFTINEDGTVTSSAIKDGVVVVKDELTKIKVGKKDAKTGLYVAGAELQIKTADGKIAKTIKDETLSWTTEASLKEIEGLPAIDPETKEPIVYTLHEEKAPQGYALAADQTFTISEKPEEKVLVVEDEPTIVRLQKVDENKNGFEGATLQLLDKNGELIKEWVSNGSPEVFEYLNVNEVYTLKETQTKDDTYVYAKDIQFTINEFGNIVINGETQESKDILMINFKTNTSVLKVDSKDSKIVLSGAVFQLKDGKTVLYEWTSESTAYHISGLTVGKEYTIHEKKAPKGYKKAKDKKFVINPDGTVQYEGTTVTDENGATTIFFADTKINPGTGTGVQSNTPIYTGTALASLAGAAVILLKRRKETEEE